MPVLFLGYVIRALNHMALTLTRSLNRLPYHSPNPGERTMFIVLKCHTAIAIK